MRDLRLSELNSVYGAGSRGCGNSPKGPGKGKNKGSNGKGSRDKGSRDKGSKGKGSKNKGSKGCR